MHNSSLEMGPRGEFITHMQRIAITAQPCKGLQILGSNRLGKACFAARLTLFEVNNLR
jgi:hypothetical protein